MECLLAPSTLANHVCIGIDLSPKPQPGHELGPHYKSEWIHKTNQFYYQQSCLNQSLYLVISLVIRKQQIGQQMMERTIHIA